MKNFKQWNEVFRLETIPLSIMCILIGSGLASYYGRFNGLVCFLACCTSACLQVACNVANDYGDFISGADALNKYKPQSAIQRFIVSALECRKAIVMFSLLAAVFGLTTMIFAELSFVNFCKFLGLGFFAIIAAITYTVGKNAYGYKRLGDISVMIFFGFVGVCGSFYIQTQKWQWISVALAIGYGCLVIGVLNINNIRDIEADRLAKKHTLASWWGIRNAIIFQCFLIIIHIITCIFYTIYLFDNIIFIFVQIPSFTFFYFVIKKLEKSSPSEMNEILKMHVLGTIIFSLLLVGSFFVKSLL